MQDSSFESFNLDDYTLDVADFFSDYIIHEEKTKPEYVVYKGVMKNSPQAVKIYKRPFPNDPAAKQRFKTLMTAFHQGIVLADNIFLSYENDQYYIYVVEPLFTGYQDKFIPLAELLKLDLDYFKKHRLFQNLVIIVKSLHALGEPHLELCPKNIWIEDQFLVYLRPFRLKLENPNLFYSRKLDRLKQAKHQPGTVTDSRYWYMAPEQTIRDFKQFDYNDYDDGDDSFNSEEDKGFSDFASDMWSLGCVFAEMFVSLTPVFQSVDTFDRIIRFFEVLGIPKKEDVFYMSQELYETILEHINSRVYNDNEFPLITELVKNLSKNEAKVLTSLLLFNPNKRPRCDILIQFPFFKSYVPDKHRNSVEFVAQNEMEENIPIPKSSSKKNTSYTGRANESKEHPSTVYPNNTMMDNSHDTSLRNMSNWWNIDPIITPKDEHIFSKNQPQNQYELHQRSDILHYHNKSAKKVPSMDQNYSYNIGRQSYKPEPSERKSTIPSTDRHHKQQYSQSYIENQPQNYSQNYGQQEVLPSRSVKNSAMKDNLKIDSSINMTPPPNKVMERRSSASNLTQNHKRELSRIDSARQVQEERYDLPPKHEKSYEKSLRSHRNADYEKENRLSQSNIKKETGPKVRISINIEVLKNLTAHNLSGSYSCRIDFKTSKNSSDSEAINLFSHFANVKDRTVRMDFKGEIDLDLESLLHTYKEHPLKIFVFFKGNPLQMKNQNTDVFLYGVTEVDLALLLMNPANIIKGKDLPRNLMGWYHIYDPEDNYKTMGQMKLEISLSPAVKTAFKNTSVSPLKRNDTEVYTPRYEEGGSTTERNRDYGDRSYKEEKEIRKLRERPSERPSEKPKERVKEKEIEKSDKKPRTTLRGKEKEVSRSPISIRNQSKSPVNKTEKGKTPGKLPSSLVVNVKKPQKQISTSIFSAIEQDLTALNEELKRKESEFEHLTIKTTRKNYNHYNDDFGHTLQKLRQILEGEEEFHY